jgi:hypothetical protein
MLLELGKKSGAAVVHKKIEKMVFGLIVLLRNCQNFLGPLLYKGQKYVFTIRTSKDAELPVDFKNINLH